MAVGKRLRFQIFRRDNFACRYCGLAATDGAVLEVDHIQPKADGGLDIATNLITACESCNSGKSDIPLDAPVVDDVPQAVFHAAMQERERKTSLDPELPEWVHDLDIAAGVAWSQGFRRPEWPQVWDRWLFSLSFTLAVATGHKAKDIERAAFAAGQAQESDLLPYLPGVEEKEEPEEEAAYYDAVSFMETLIPWERERMIWRARAAAGTYCPTISELIRAAAGFGKRYIEEEDRDKEALSRWLDLLPGNEGSAFRVKATADWDAHCQGRRGSSAHECPDEVLDLAVSYALGTRVPA